VLADTVRAIDPTYVDDFWNKPGYLGTEQSPLGDLIRAAGASDPALVALYAYHRHQVPSRPDFPGWDQFRDVEGQPIHPQRPVEVGPIVAASTSGGGTHTGRINGKVIVVQNLLDSDAFPWHADWYRKQVGASTDFRVWFNDHADHQFGPVTGRQAARIVEFTGIYQQALRDVSAWVEKGVPPPPSTRYSVAGSQVTVPERATARRGVQPVVDLTAGRTDRIEVRAGQPVTFKAHIQVPPRAGRIVATEWDFMGTGAFTTRPFGPARPTVQVHVTFTYTKRGTYFPVLRATAQRHTDSPYTKVQNLDRVRVVVR